MGTIFGKVMTKNPEKRTRLYDKICLDQDVGNMAAAPIDHRQLSATAARDVLGGARLRVGSADRREGPLVCAPDKIEVLRPRLT